MDIFPPSATTTRAGAPGDEQAQRQKIREAARDLETTFLAQMLGHMFAGTTISAPFGGGSGESRYRSLLYQEYAGLVTAAGGTGIAAAVERELLRLNGLQPSPPPAGPPAA